MSGACEEFFQKYGRDGRNYTARAIYDCFYDPTEEVRQSLYKLKCALSSFRCHWIITNYLSSLFSGFRERKSHQLSYDGNRKIFDLSIQMDKRSNNISHVI